MNERQPETGAEQAAPMTMGELREHRVGDLLDLLDQIDDGCVLMEFEGNDHGEPVRIAVVVTKDKAYIDMVKQRMEREAFELLKKQRKAERKALRAQRGAPIHANGGSDSNGG